MKKSFFLSGILLLFFVFLAVYIQFREKISDEIYLKKAGWLRRPYFQDDFDIESLVLAINKNKEYLLRVPPDRLYQYGEFSYTAREVVDSYDHFLHIVTTSTDTAELNKRIVKDFHIIQSIGYDQKRNVLFTGYYEPVLKGSLKKTDRYRFPLYQKPNDLILIDLGQFRRNLEGKSIIAKVKNGRVTPYDDREAIDQLGTLDGKNLEIAWVDNPIDIFFLHIQGSGIIQLENGGSLNVNYAGSNGRDYDSIGRLLIKEGKIPKEKMSMKAIREYLTDNPEETARIFNYNKSYVFFRTVDEGPVGSTGVTVTGGRSIASDRKVFPKGGLAYIETEIPVTNGDGDVVEWKTTTRFVVDQDVGGAIKGPGRIDLFFGTGKEAGDRAGAMNRDGKIFYLIRKR